MLKLIFCCFICLYAMALPSFAELTPQDLDKIRLIIYEENQSIKTEIGTIKTEIGSLKTEMAAMKDEIVNVKGEVSWIRGKLDNIDKYLAWLMVLIVVAIGIPQIVVAWRSRKDRALEKQIETLRQEIEAMKQQHTVSQ